MKNKDYEIKTLTDQSQINDFVSGMNIKLNKLEKLNRELDEELGIEHEK